MNWTAKKVLVAGDFLLDVYTLGEVKRISPEAPVPILHVHAEEQRLGGAGNVVLNLLSLGMEVAVLGRVGADSGGALVRALMEQERVGTQGLVTDAGCTTPVKRRMLASGQQLLRVDYEDLKPLCAPLEEQLCAQMPSLLKEVAVVALSDYAKGFLTSRILQTLIEEARLLHIPVLVDPKGADFSRYKGSFLLKPNLCEAYAAAGLPASATLDQVAQHLLQKTSIPHLMITRAHEGISLFTLDCPRIDFPAAPHAVRDVTGAGDTVLAVVTAALANGWPLERAAPLANRAAGLALEQVGCARIRWSELQ